MSVHAPPADLAAYIEAIIEKRSGCLCGRGESCEECSGGSRLNMLRAELRDLVDDLRGRPRRSEPTLLEYAKTTTVPIGPELQEPPDLMAASVELIARRATDEIHDAIVRRLVKEHNAEGRP